MLKKMLKKSTSRAVLVICIMTVMGENSLIVSMEQAPHSFVAGHDRSTKFCLSNSGTCVTAAYDYEEKGIVTEIDTYSHDVRAYARNNNKRIRKMLLSGVCSVLAASQKTSDVACAMAGESNLHLIDVDQSKFKGDLREHLITGACSSLHFDRKSKKILSAHDTGQCVIWDLRMKRCVSILKGHEGRVHCAQWHPHKNQIASCGSDKTVRIWDLRMPKSSPLIVKNDTETLKIAYTSSGTRLLAGGMQIIRLYDTQHGSLLEHKNMSESHHAPIAIISLAVNPCHDKRFALGTDTGIIALGKISDHCSKNTEQTTIAFSPLTLFDEIAKDLPRARVPITTLFFDKNGKQLMINSYEKNMVDCYSLKK